MSDLRYPIGRFTAPDAIAAARRTAWIDDIAAAPAAMRKAVAGLSPEQLDTPYRPDGWTVRQVVHHVPDSHLNAYVRFKRARQGRQGGGDPRPGLRGGKSGQGRSASRLASQVLKSGIEGAAAHMDHPAAGQGAKHRRR